MRVEFMCSFRLIRGRERRITPGTVLYLISTEMESVSAAAVLAGQTISSEVDPDPMLSNTVVIFWMQGIGFAVRSKAVLSNGGHFLSSL